MSLPGHSHVQHDEKEKEKGKEGEHEVKR